MKTMIRFVTMLVLIYLSIAQGQTWPLNTPDQLSSAFGPRNMGTAEYPDINYNYDFHAGIDIVGSAGSDVKAIESGVVVFWGTV